MSTYIEEMYGQAALKNAADAEKFADAIASDVFPDGIDWNWDSLGVINFSTRSEAYSDWHSEMLRVLDKFCSAWDIEVKEEECDPMRIFKDKCGEEGEVCGTQFTYYPGFEDDFIRRLPHEIIAKIKAEGGKENE